VGLELRVKLATLFVWYFVTIPHGGVKTSPKKPENQNFLPIKIETAHREGTLTHIQLPS